jgi:futalosine hydrolase
MTMALKNILIVCATFEEIKGLLPAPVDGAVSMGQIFPLNHKRHSVDLLVTGPGMIPTVYFAGKVLGAKYYDLAINAGIAGSFNKKISLGDVVNVINDCLAEPGAEPGDHFIPLYKMGMSKAYKPEFMDEEGNIENSCHPLTATISSLPAVKGVTVNSISGKESDIVTLHSRTGADIETMEGAAFFYACRMSDTTCLQIRAISNYVEARNLDKWDIPNAVKHLNETIKIILDEI